jgi:hypothetical protein
VVDVAPLSGNSTLATAVVSDSWDDEGSNGVAAFAIRASRAILARFAGATRPSSSPSKSRSTLDAFELDDREESLSKEAASASMVELGEVVLVTVDWRLSRPMPWWVPLARRMEE